MTYIRSVPEDETVCMVSRRHMLYMMCMKSAVTCVALAKDTFSYREWNMLQKSVGRIID